MYLPSTDAHGAELLTWFLEASRAKTSALPERAKASPEIGAGYGERWPESWVRFDQATSSWKTHQFSLLGDLESFSGTWPQWGMMVSGECLALDTSALSIVEIGYGDYLPTPSGTSNHGKNHVSGRLDEWGGSGNPWRGTEIGKLHCPRFEEWMMDWPDQWTALTPFGMDKFHSWLNLRGGL